MGLELLNFLSKKKKDKISQLEKKDAGLKTLEPEKVPEYTPGLQSDGTIVRLVSNKKIKNPYRVSGIDDVASKNNWKAWLYLAPVIVLVVIFLLYPLINTIFISVTKNYDYTTGKYESFTLENFGVILHLIQANAGTEQAAWETSFTSYAIPNTLIITFVTVPISIILALIIAVALNSIKAFQKFLQTVFFLPYVTNSIAIGMVFSVLFADDGLINFMFGLQNAGQNGGPMQWIYNAPTEVAMVPLCLFIIWNSIPFKILILLSGLQGIDKQYYQAAQIDASSKAKTFRRITVPLLSPQILYLMITSFIGAFKEYNSIVSIFGKKGETLAGKKNMYTIVFYVYDNISVQTSYAAAAAVFLFIIILLFTFFQFWVSKKRVHY